MYRGGKEKEARDRKKETSAGEEEDLFIFNDTIEKRRRDRDRRKDSEVEEGTTRV